MVCVTQFLSHIWAGMGKSRFKILTLLRGGPLISPTGDVVWLTVSCGGGEVIGLLLSEDTDFSSGAETSCRLYSLSMVFMFYLIFFPYCQLQYSISLHFVATLMFPLWVAYGDFSVDCTFF